MGVLWGTQLWAEDEAPLVLLEGFSGPQTQNSTSAARMRRMQEEREETTRLKKKENHLHSETLCAPLQTCSSRCAFGPLPFPISPATKNMTASFLKEKGVVRDLRFKSTKLHTGPKNTSCLLSSYRVRAKRESRATGVGSYGCTGGGTR